MIRTLPAALAAVLLLVETTGAAEPAAPAANPAAETANADAAFKAVARKFRGFRMISNRPPLPETVFFTQDKQQVTLKAFQGKALLINFWATWCTPCVREMPDLNALQEELGGDAFEVVAIASGAQMGKTPEVFLKEHDLSALKLYLDPHASLMDLFGTRTLPTTLVADRQGRILGGVMGEAKWTTPAARAVLRHLIEN